MKIFKNIMKYLTSTLLALLVIVSLYTLISISLLKQSYVNLFGYTYFVIASGSMSPTIDVNDIIIVDIGAEYKEDDIITYKSGDAFVTHRLIKENKNTLVTKGDANNVEDSNVKKTDVVGKVVLTLSSAFLLKVLGTVIILFIIVSVVNFDDLFKKYIKREKTNVKSPLEYTSIIPIIKEDNELVDEILSKTTVHDIAKAELKRKMLELKLGDSDLSEPIQPQSLGDKEVVKELIHILKSNNRKSKITTEGAIKLQYMYKLCKTVEIDPLNVEKVIDNAPFEELFDYNFEKIGFTKTVNNRIYSMPIYVYLLIMTYAIVYDNDEFFDAMFKALKYRVKIDPSNRFITNDYKVDKCVKYIERVVHKCEHPEKFELDKIKKLVILDRE